MPHSRAQSTRSRATRRRDFNTQQSALCFWSFAVEWTQNNSSTSDLTLDYFTTWSLTQLRAMPPVEHINLSTHKSRLKSHFIVADVNHPFNCFTYCFFISFNSILEKFTEFLIFNQKSLRLGYQDRNCSLAAQHINQRCRVWVSLGEWWTCSNASAREEWWRKLEYLFRKTWDDDELGVWEQKIWIREKIF